MATPGDDDLTTTTPVQCVEDLLNQLPPEKQERAKLFTKSYEKANSLNILITGKTGTGKSTLTNGLLGFDFAKQGDRLGPGTKGVNAHRAEINGVRLCVWDTPGFQDGTVDQDQYLHEIEEKCSKRDLTLYCIKTGGETKFVDGEENNDVVAMKKLTEKFEEKFWKNTVIVLTFANALGKMDDDWEEYSDEKKKEVFTSRIQEWQGQIRYVLTDKLKIPKEVADKIPIVPAGHTKPHLVDINYWLSTLWRTCACSCRSGEVKAALFKMSQRRIKLKKNVDDKQMQPQEPMKQPLILERIVGTDMYSAVGSALEHLAEKIYTDSVKNTASEGAIALVKEGACASLAAVRAPVTAVAAGLTVVTIGLAAYLTYELLIDEEEIL